MRTTMRGVATLVMWLVASRAGAQPEGPPPEERAPTKCGVVTDSFKAPKAAPVKRTTANGFSVFFESEAAFKPDPDPPYKCMCCEFRQRIKGEAFVNGVVQRVVLVLDDPTSPTGTKESDLKKDDFQEDSRDYGSGRGRYGHRGDPKRWTEDYTKGGTGPDSATVDRANGCAYKMSDAPGISGLRPGDTGKIDFTFEQSIVSVCPGGCDGCEVKPPIQATAEHTIPKKCQIAAGSPERGVPALLVLGAIVLAATRRRGGGRS